MYRYIALLALLIVVSASQADDLSMPRKLDETGPLGGPALVDRPANGGNQSITNLRVELARLQAAREALQLDEKELSAQAEPHPEQSKAEEIARLQQRLKVALKQIEENRKQKEAKKAPQLKKPYPATTERVASPNELPKLPDPPMQPIAPSPVDALALGPVLFQTGDYEGALTAFHLLHLDSLGAQDRLTVMYMTAACLRKLGKAEDAAALFREVANSKGDDLLVECAQWQLSAIRWRRDVESKLDEMRQRRKALETKT